MLESPKNTFRVAAEYQPLMRILGLDGEAIFNDPRIVPWRRLPDRENCTLDADLGDAWRTPHVRLHIKRYAPVRGISTATDDEVKGHGALSIEGIPTAALVGWGKRSDGRSFTIFEDLAAFAPADKLIEAGTPFDRLLEATADLAAKLHGRGLHHRDLYLCHFMVKVPIADVGAPDLRLIDVARVGRLGGVFTRGRWIVKDLAQFWYSTLSLPITDAQRDQWLARYCAGRNLVAPGQIAAIRRRILSKVARIARHDANLRAKQPLRNISIPRSKAGAKAPGDPPT